MKLGPSILAALFTCTAAGLTAQKPAARRTFKGAISDSACGLHHMMGGTSPPKCTLECVDLGAKFVLANQATQKVYGLSDQTAARLYAGEPVKVIGTLKGSTIQVTSIQPLAKESKRSALVAGSCEEPLLFGNGRLGEKPARMLPVEAFVW